MNLNSCAVRLKKRLRFMAGWRLFQPLMKFYVSRARGCIRVFLPLFDATAMLSVTRRCQCACVHCGVAGYPPEQRAELSPDEIFSTIDEFARLGGQRIYFFGGEPLLAPRLCDYVRRARLKGLETELDTNGLLLDENKVLELKAAGIGLVRVSLDSPDAAEHDRLRGVPGIFNKAVSGVKFCARHGVECHISAYASKAALRGGGLDRLAGLAESLGAKLRVLSPVRSGRWLDSAVSLSSEELALLKSRLKDGAVYWETEYVSAPERAFFCGAAARNFFYVSACGEVQPCAYIPLSFGNLLDEPLGGIIRRMWACGALGPEAGCRDCLMNSDDFRRRLDGFSGSPKKYRRSSPNDKAEWDGWAAEYSAQVDWLDSLHDDELLSMFDFSGKKILDLGCGTGRFLGRAALPAESCEGWDFSGEMLKTAARNLSGKNVRLEPVDFEKDALPQDRRFDFITASQVMHHVADPDAALEKLKPLLLPGGRLVIIDSLSGRSAAERLKFYAAEIRRCGALKCAAFFLKNVFSDSRMKRHKRREAEATLEEFRSRYRSPLAGAEVSVRHGIFGYLVWTKP